MKKKNNQNVVRHILQPPSYISNSIVSRVFRFQFLYLNNGTAQTFTFTASKLGALQVIGTVANTTAALIYEAARIRKIEMWASPPVDGSIVDISVVYAGSALGVQGPDRGYSAQTVGMTRPAYLCASPGRMTQAAQWQTCATTVGTNNLFNFIISGTGASGTITVTADVHLALRMTQDSRTTGNTVSLTVVAVSSFYYLALDNPAGGTGSVGNLWIPDRSLVTTT